MKHSIRIFLTTINLLCYSSYLWSTKIEVYFSPQDKIHSKLIQAIDATQKKIYAAVYMITDKTIVTALVKAKQERGVDVQIITDAISLGSSYGKAESLAQQGITVFMYKPSVSLYNPFFKTNAIMHHKFALFDTMIWTGSFNWTRSADTRNKENVVAIYDDLATYNHYLQHFEVLKKECTNCATSYKKALHYKNSLSLYKDSCINFNKQNACSDVCMVNYR